MPRLSRALTSAPQVKAAHRVAPAIEFLRYVLVTPAVFAQAVHDKHLRFGQRRIGQRPIAQRQLHAWRKV